MEDLQRHIENIINEQNNHGLEDFDGYSPFEMQLILHNTFESNSPVQLQKLSNSDYTSIPILNQIKYLGDLIDKKGELKLTEKGFLPRKIVAEIYAQGFIPDELVESGILKLSNESDLMNINLTRILLEISGIGKKRNGKLCLTKNGEKLLSNNFDLLKQIFISFGFKFNWAYYDGYGENQIGQLGFGFSLILLSKYGSEKQVDQFYGKKYLKAFPMLLENVEPSEFNTRESQAIKCYSLRTFDRFLDYFGLIKIDSDEKSDSPKFIRKTELFDKVIKIQPHSNIYKT